MSQPLPEPHLQAPHSINGSLPALSVDDSEVFLGAVVERSGGTQLHLATFMLCHHMLGTEVKKAIHVSALRQGRLNNTLAKSSSVSYKTNGQRSDQPFHICKIKHSASASAYVVPGVFIPNRQNFDPNANRRVDILRCEMQIQGDHRNIADHISAGDLIQVEIYRGRQQIIHFEVPWRDRRVGYMLSSHPDASKWDPWKGFETLGHHALAHHAVRNASSAAPITGLAASLPMASTTPAQDNVFLCVPAIRRPPNRFSVGPILEFVEHHLLLGVSHIFLGVAFSWNSEHMGHLLQLLRSYINEGTVSVISEAGDNVDFASSFLGLRFSRGDTKTMFHNMCLYMAKGAATYAAFWDIDEFFVPQGSESNIVDIIRSSHLQEDHSRMRSARKMHPVCYMSVSTRDFLPLYPTGSGEPWVGSRFAYEPPKTAPGQGRAIVPTKNIFYAGILTAGTCRLDPKWTDCSGSSAEFCFGTGAGRELSVHNFDDRMAPEDVLNLPPPAAMLYHYQTFASAAVAKLILSRDGNQYSNVFYPAVKRGLRNRGLEAMISLPAIDMDASLGVNLVWKDISLDQRSKDGSGFLVEDLLGDFFDSEGDEISNRTTMKSAAVELPEFAADYSELFLSSLLEREFESPKLRVTVFMMNHAQLLRNAVTGVNVQTLNITMKPVWDVAMKAFTKTKYKVTGERDEKYYCRVKFSSDSTMGESTLGRFMPNRLSPDANANRKLDVFRCPFEVSSEQFERLHDSSELLEVEILRENSVRLISFMIPWRTRRTGYMLTSPPSGSGFNAWKGAKRLYEQSKLSNSVGVDQYGAIDNLYMCVPGMESPFDRRMLPLYAEFVEHHIQLGVEHMFVSATYDIHGLNMKLLSGAFQSYIKEGLMTLSSQAGDNQDYRYGFKGLTMDRDNIKVMFVNMCLYMSKGQADYVAIWDFDEFFIPKLPHNSIMDVIRHAEGNRPVPLPVKGENIEMVMQNWQKGPGLADGDGHPFCYLIVDSETINSDGDVIDPDYPWIGDRFSHDTEVTHLSFQKSIHPTRKIYQVGLHIGGSCKLPVPWNGCSPDELEETEFCYRADKSIGVGALNKVTWINSSTFIDFMRFQAFDEGTTVADAKRLDIDSDAIIYHIQAHRSHLVSKKEALNGPINEYASRFFENVFKKLHDRGIVLMQTLPQSLKKAVVTANLYWEPWIPIFTDKSQFPTGPKLLLPQPGEPVLNGSYWEPKQGLLPVETAVAILPSFSADGLEYILGSVIERVTDSMELHLTTFFLGHTLLDTSKKGDLHGTRVAASVKEPWVNFAKQHWKDNHKAPWLGRIPEIYYCRIRNYAADSEYYTVTAEFVPNKGTPDSGTNRRLDILRCKLNNTEIAYSRLRSSSSEIIVEIFRDDVFLIKFGVSWSTRKSGYAMSSPKEKLASKLNAWKGADELLRKPTDTSNGKTLRGLRSEGRDVLHMCVPGLESFPTKTSIPLYLEFIQHHLLLGVDHISIATIFPWGSVHMDRLQMLLTSFIDDGSVSLSSQSGDGIENVYSTSGLSWFRDNSKIFFVNMCFYHSKGNADYVAVWDFDEFFIPKPPHNSIIDVIRAMEGNGNLPAFPDSSQKMNVQNLKDNWKGGPGLADGHMHPFCYMSLSEQVVCNDNSEGGTFDYSHPWIGQRFTHGVEPADFKEAKHMSFKKSIVPTDRIFFVGLHMHGACSLPFPWNGCEREEEYCYSQNSKQQQGLMYDSEGSVWDFSFTQNFDGMVWDADAKKINMETEAVIYHFQVHRSYLEASTTALKGKNDYAEKFFPNVMRKLRERGFIIIEHFPEDLGSKVIYDNPKVQIAWKPLFVAFLKRIGVREFFP